MKFSACHKCKARFKQSESKMEFKPVTAQGALNRATETLTELGHLLGLTYTGLLIFHAVAELRISSKSAKSCEIHKNTQNPTKCSSNQRKTHRFPSEICSGSSHEIGHSLPIIFSETGLENSCKISRFFHKFVLKIPRNLTFFRDLPEALHIYMTYISHTENEQSSKYPVLWIR